MTQRPNHHPSSRGSGGSHICGMLRPSAERMGFLSPCSRYCRAKSGGVASSVPGMAGTRAIPINLITNHGWHGVMIEGDSRKCVELRQTYANNSKVIVLYAMVGFEGGNTLGKILSSTPIPVDFDLLSIDIDGNDYHVWEALRNYTPKVVVIEFNPTIPNSIAFVQEARMTVNQGSSLRQWWSSENARGTNWLLSLHSTGFSCTVLSSLASAYWTIV